MALSSTIATDLHVHTKQLQLHNSAALVARLPSHLANGSLIVVHQHNLSSSAIYSHLLPSLQPGETVSSEQRRGAVVSFPFPRSHKP